MDDGALRLRIRVISVSTRAAVHSLGPASPQIHRVVERGNRLLDSLEPLILEQGSDDVRRAFTQAREDLVSMDGQSES